MDIKWKKFKLLDVASVSENRVGKFVGEKDYIATGDLGLSTITGGTPVTYSDRPSRADLVMNENEVLFAKMKATVKVLVGSEAVQDKIFSTGFYILRPQENVSKQFLYFYLRSGYFNQQKDFYCAGATMSAITNEGLKKIFISLPVDKNGNPDRPEQDRIVKILEETELIKEKREEANRKMETLAPALFDEMFGREKDTWSKVKISEIVKGKGAIRTGPFGSALHHSEFTETGIPVLAIDNVSLNKFKWNKQRNLPPEKYKKFQQFRVYPGDVLVTIMGTVGRVCVAPDNLPECMSTKHLCVITPDTTKVDPRFLRAELLFDERVRHQTRNVAKGAIMEGWNSTIIKNLTISVPPVELQKEFGERMKEIEIQKEKQELAEAKTNELFASLLGKYFPISI